MADRADILFQSWKEQREHARQHENQRAAMTNIITVMASVIVGFIAQIGLARAVLPLTITLIVIGVYGYVASAKYFERYRFCEQQARVLLAKLDETDSELRLLEVRQIAKQQQIQQFPVITRLKLHHIWEAIFIVIALAGLVMTVVAI